MQKTNSPTKQTEFNSVVPKPLEPKNLSLFKTIDTQLTQSPEIAYSEKLDEIIVSGFVRTEDNYQIQVFDGKTFARKGAIQAHKARIHKLVLLPEELVATVSADKSVKIWRLVDGPKLVHDFKLKYEPLDLCVNQSLMAAIIVGKSLKISCYDIKTGTLMSEISGANAEGYSSCAFLKDQNVLIAGLADSHVAHVIDCINSSVVSTLDGGEKFNPTIGVQLVEPSQVVVASDNAITVWDLTEPRNPKRHDPITPPINKINHFCAIPNEDAIVLTYNSSNLHFFKYTDGNFLGALPTKLPKCYSVKYARAGDRILVADSEEGSIGVFVRKERASKSACQGCTIF